MGLSESIEAIYKCNVSQKLELPLYNVPSLISDYNGETVDINSLLINNPDTTYFVVVAGKSMIGVGIDEQDYLIVDRSLEADDEDIVIASVDGNLMVRRLRLVEEQALLVPENLEYGAIAITESVKFYIWGVVTSYIHQLRDPE